MCEHNSTHSQMVLYSRLEIWATVSLFWAGMKLQRQEGQALSSWSRCRKVLYRGRPEGAGQAWTPRRDGAARRAGRAGRRSPSRGSGTEVRAAVRGDGAAGRAAVLARRPRQRRGRRSLLRPWSLLRRLSSLAGSPPPPQPRRCSGCSSPSRPGRAAGTIPGSAGWWPPPVAAGGHL